MSIIKQLSLFTLAAILALTGCSQPTPTPSDPANTNTSTPIPTREPFVVDNSPSARAVVVPKEDMQMAFTITGRVKNVYFGIGETVKAGEVLATLDTTMLEADLDRAHSVLAAAQAELAFQKLQPDNTPELQAVSESRVSQAEADLAIAESRLDEAILLAPANGTVVDLQMVIGETVTPGKVVLVLADLQHLRVETTDLSETDVPLVFLGQTAYVYIDSLKVNLEGVVETISPQATLLGEKRVYKITIRLLDQPEGLRWGMSAGVRFAPKE